MSAIEDIVRRTVREEVLPVVREEIRAVLHELVLERKAPTSNEQRAEPQAERLLVGPLPYSAWWWSLPEADRPPYDDGIRWVRLPEAAHRLGIAPTTLYGWRHDGKGPSYSMRGRLAMYREDVLDRWIAAQRR